MVLESAMIMPSASDCSTPSGPNKILSTAAVSETQSQTTSAPCAAAAGLGAMPAPSTILPGVRFHTVTSWPALTRFAAMACPIIPRPKKATRISKLLLGTKGLFELDMSKRIEVKQSRVELLLRNKLRRARSTRRRGHRDKYFLRLPREPRELRFVLYGPEVK